MLFHIAPFKAGGACEYFAKHAAAIGVDPVTLREERKRCLAELRSATRTTLMEAATRRILEAEEAEEAESGRIG
jgi:hypothetical protein